MRVLVNGEARECAPGMTVAQLLAELGLAGAAVAVERNQRLVPRTEHATSALADGDRIELVTLVGGG
jgi:sulfur carrier protein